jgi:hypothetical protein
MNDNTYLIGDETKRQMAPQPSTALPSTRHSPARRFRIAHALTILDFMSLIAGFAVGFVLHQISAFRLPRRWNPTQNKPGALPRRQCLARLFPPGFLDLVRGHPRRTRPAQATGRVGPHRGVIRHCGALLGRLLALRRVHLPSRDRSGTTRRRSKHVAARSRRRHRRIGLCLGLRQTGRSSTPDVE